MTKPVSGADIVKLPGTYLTRVYEGPYSDARKWARDMRLFVAQRGKRLEQLYFAYTTCPACAKAYDPHACTGFDLHGLARQYVGDDLERAKVSELEERCSRLHDTRAFLYDAQYLAIHGSYDVDLLVRAVPFRLALERESRHADFVVGDARREHGTRQAFPQRARFHLGALEDALGGRTIRPMARPMRASTRFGAQLGRIGEHRAAHTIRREIDTCTHMNYRLSYAYHVGSARRAAR